MPVVMLILVLISADGKPQERAFEQPSLEVCWAKANEVVAKADKAFEAGFTGYGAACIIFQAPTQGS